MEFCPNCEMRLIPTKSLDQKGKYFLSCPKCNYKKILNEKKVKYSWTTKRAEHEDIAIVSKKEAKYRTLPITKSECPTCGNKKAYWWMVQTRGSDESPTQFFRCTKCQHTWREMA